MNRFSYLGIILIIFKESFQACLTKEWGKNNLYGLLPNEKEETENCILESNPSLAKKYFCLIYQNDKGCY